MALIYDVAFNSQTRVLSLLDKAGNVISSCEVPSKTTELTLTATAGNSSVKLIKNGTLSNTYEVNVGSGWTAYKFGTVIPLNAGESCKWRCSAHPTTQSSSNYVSFSMLGGGTIEASGNCNSMLSSNFDKITKVPNCAFIHLFDLCTQLTKAPDLPATTLSYMCYYQMFYGCSFVQAPYLPATELATKCYSRMFYNCLKLKEVRTAMHKYMGTALDEWLSGVGSSGDFYADPAFTSSSGIPRGWKRWVLGAEDTGTTTTMYHNGSAETVKVGTSDYGACYTLQGWAGFKTLDEMHTLGYTLGAQTSLTMYAYDSPVSAYSCEANTKDNFTETMYDVGDGNGYLDIATQNANDFYLTVTPYTGLTLTATADNSSVKLIKNGTLFNAYEVNTGNGWSPYYVVLGKVINLNAGQSCRWRCSKHPTTQSSSIYVNFVMTGSIEASGNITSMVTSDFENITSLSGYNYAFARLFSGCTALTKVSALQCCQTLSPWCFYETFKGCSGLNNDAFLMLPKTVVLAESCCYGMYSDCIGLLNVYAYGETLENNCFNSMFSGCTGLMLAFTNATTMGSATNAFKDWLYGVTTTDPFTIRSVYAYASLGLPTNSFSGIPTKWSRKEPT